MEWINYHHLLYFWTVAREGSVTRACELLHLAQPTISNQLRKLEKRMGGKLFQKVGRNLQLTDLGRVVFRYADEIYSIGQELSQTVAGRPSGRPLQLVVGATESLPKMVVHRLLAPAYRVPEPIRLECREASWEQLLVSLASFDMDLVISDTPVTSGALRIKAFNHLLGESSVSVFGVRRLAKKYRPGFPKSLAGAPLLVAGSGTHAYRIWDAWCDEQGIHPEIVGRFQDSALLKVFGQDGQGLFTSPTVIADEICRQYDVEIVGNLPNLKEKFYAISVERRLRHPAVLEILNAARTEFLVETAT